MASNRKLTYGVYPRAGWGICDWCHRDKQLLFYFNPQYGTNLEAARRAPAAWVCRRCIDS